jgi:hypothetical protein
MTDATAGTIQGAKAAIRAWRGQAIKAPEGSPEFISAYKAAFEETQEDLQDANDTRKEDEDFE